MSEPKNDTAVMGPANIEDLSTIDLASVPMQLTLAEFERLASALFHHTNQHLMVRVMETAGKDRPPLIHFPDLYLPLSFAINNPGMTTKMLQDRADLAAETYASVFFSVCTRLKDKGRYDRCWQITEVHFLWCDLDGIDPRAAIALCIKAGVPPPTAVVDSGHGTHLYWKLKDIYHINDIAWNPPVEFDYWIDEVGSREYYKYIVEETTNERIILSNDRHEPREPRPSPKAIYLMRILKGIAKAIGGDCTYDLSRLLRVVGTLNRKNQREGQTPVPCMIYELNPDRVYSVDDFEKFAGEEIRETQLEKVLLPAKKRKSDSRRTDKLCELLNVCALAPEGTRSERDFHFCCQAVKDGWEKEAAWKLCEHVGRFAQSRRAYFDRTWANAEFAVRNEILTRAEKKATRLAKAAALAEAHAGQPGSSKHSDDFEDQTDVANAARLIESYGERLRWCQAFMSWLVWDGKRWRRDATLQAERLVFELRHQLKWELDQASGKLMGGDTTSDSKSSETD